MVSKKCPGCAKRIEKKFNYCPYCGISIKLEKEKENFGFLGRNDCSESGPDERKGYPLPLGLSKLVESLAKQLEKQIGNISFENLSEDNRPGFKIKISTEKAEPEEEEECQEEELSEEEIKRRMKLPKVNANSRFKRLSDKIVYELEVPGVNSLSNVEVDELEDGFEIRAYSKNKCFVKVINIKSDIKNYYIEGGKLILELSA